LTAVCTAYATQPFLPFFHPPIVLASLRPRGHLHLNRRIDFSAICFGTRLHIVVASIPYFKVSRVLTSLVSSPGTILSEVEPERETRSGPTSLFDLEMGYFSIIG
jgi:hypothetical protein